MPKLHLHLLGSPKVEIDGQTADIQRRKVLALLVYLAVTGQVQRRDSLAALFWPDNDQSKVHASLCPSHNSPTKPPQSGKTCHKPSYHVKTTIQVPTTGLDTPMSKPTDQLDELFDRLDPDRYYGLDESIGPIHWHWPGWLSPGFLTILAGRPGSGKSSLCLHFSPLSQPCQPQPTQLEKAINFLQDQLAGSPRPAAQVKAAAQAADHALPTLKRAKKQLRIQSTKQTDQWLWHLHPHHSHASP